jgi:hypothetical protein
VAEAQKKAKKILDTVRRWLYVKYQRYKSKLLPDKFWYDRHNVMVHVGLRRVIRKVERSLLEGSMNIVSNSYRYIWYVPDCTTLLLRSWRSLHYASALLVRLQRFYYAHFTTTCIPRLLLATIPLCLFRACSK